jgi:hypothetical protein
MSIWSKLFPGAASRPPAIPTQQRRGSAGLSSPPIVGRGNSGYFEALQVDTNRSVLNYSALSMQSYGSTYSRERLAAISRYLYDNYPMVGYAVNTIEQYSVPIFPQAVSPDPAWNKLAEAYFANWSDNADFTGRFDFCDLQRMACRAIDTDGDSGFYFTKEAGFPQLQVLESWRIGLPPARANDAGFMGGVQVDPKGRVLGYSVIQGENKFEILPANQTLLLYDPDRYSSYRGLSALRRGSNDIRDAQDIKAFTKKAVKIGSALSAVIEGGPVQEDVWGNDTGDNGNTSQIVTPQDKNLSVAELLGGDIPVLDQGQVFKQLQNQHTGSNVTDFLEDIIGHFVAGLDIPPAFFLDEKLTGPNQRSVNGKAQRKFNKRQEMIGYLVQWAWLRITAWGIDKGDLPAVPNWDKCRLQVPPKITIDSGRESQQERDDVGSALMTRQDSFGNRGKDWQRETDQSFIENDYILTKAQDLADRHGLPLEKILERYGWQPPKVAPTAPQENQTP